MIVLTLNVSENLRMFFNDFVVNKLLDKSKVDKFNVLIS